MVQQYHETVAESRRLAEKARTDLEQFCRKSVQELIGRGYMGPMYFQDTRIGHSWRLENGGIYYGNRRVDSGNIEFWGFYTEDLLRTANELEEALKIPTPYPVPV